MKIRFDFVTNSSSTSFASAMTSGVLGAVIGLGAMACECTAPGEDLEEEGGGSPEGGAGGEEEPGLEQEALDAALAASEQAAQEIADIMAADAQVRDEIVNSVLDAQKEKLSAAAEKLQSEIDKYNRQWQEAQQGIDPNDPGYADLKKQYEDYIGYLKNQAERVKAQQYELEVIKAEEQMARESRSDWVKQQQQDLIQVMEQKSFLEAVAKGYGKDDGYNISKVKEQLAQLEIRERELRETLQKNDADINYTPRDRGEIGPDPELAKLNREYKMQREQMEREKKAAEKIRDEAKRKELESKMKQLEKDMENEARKAAFWNVMTKGAEIVQFGADLGVDILSNVTGPYGKTIKTCYTGLKGLAGGLGEGLANGDMSKNIAKGALGGLSDILKDKVGDKWGKAAQNLYGIGSEAGKSMFESALDGKTGAEDLLKAGLGGATKGSLDAALNIIGDGLLPGGTEMPEGLDWSDIDLSTFVRSVKNNSPLTVRNLGREAIGNGLQGAGFDQVKNFIKGDDVIFSGWNQELTGKAIDTGVELGAPKYTPYAVEGVNQVGQGLKAGADLIGNIFAGSRLPVMY